MLDLVHPIGELYLTTNANFNPNTRWGGTWEKLTSDAYFKIVTSNAGALGGTSNQHKIPISSMPTHEHNMNPIPSGSGGGLFPPLGAWNGSMGTLNAWTSSSGGGQPYYPYYYGVIAWHRTA